MNRLAIFLMVFLVLDGSFMGVAEAKKQAAKQRAHHSPLGHALHHAKKMMHSMQTKPATRHPLAKHLTHHLEEAGEDEGKKKDNDDDEADDEANKDEVDEEAKDEEDEGNDGPSDQDKAKTRKMYIFLLIVFLTIVALGVICYGMAKSADDKLTPSKFMGVDSFDGKAIFVGMASGIVFGMIDNGGLFFGMEYLDPLLANLPYGDEHLVNSGYGNTFSDMIGAFMGTFVGKMIELQVQKGDPDFSLDDAPIWTGAVGITIGCIIGVMIPRAIVGPPKKVMLSDAMLEALRAGVDQDTLDEILEEFDHIDETVDKDLKNQVRKENLMRVASPNLHAIIENADLNGDGIIDRDEVVKQLTTAMERVKKFDEKKE